MASQDYFFYTIIKWYSSNKKKQECISKIIKAYIWNQMLNKYVVMLCYVVKKEKDMLNNVLKKNKIHPQYVGKNNKKDMFNVLV